MQERETFSELSGKYGILYCFSIITISLFLVTSCERYLIDSPDFDNDTARISIDSMKLTPWKEVKINQEFGGSYFLMNDVNNDGKVEIVSCRHTDINDVHSISSVACQSLEGDLLWSYGTANSGTTFIRSEQSLVLYDWDCDGQIDVLIVSEGQFIVLNAKNGKIERILPLPDNQASDCITICNISGKSRPSDILLKDRYHNIWAYDIDWNLIWHVTDPNEFLTCHRPFVTDTNGDGKDEVFVGFQLVNSNGTPLWNISPSGGGHADSYCLIQDGGAIPANYRFGVTYCFGNGMGIWTGDGKEIASIYGEHFESIYSAHFLHEMKGNQIFTQVDHLVLGPMYIMDSQANKKYSLSVKQNRFERPIRWSSSETYQIVCPGTSKIYDSDFHILFDLTLPKKNGAGLTVLTGDMNNDMKTDIAIASFTGEESNPESWYINIFVNRNGPAICSFLGSSYNYSFYNDYDDRLNPFK